MQISGIKHVQLAMPAGKEQVARDFYCGLLGIPEVPKPEKLAANGRVVGKASEKLILCNPFSHVR